MLEDWQRIFINQLVDENLEQSQMIHMSTEKCHTEIFVGLEFHFIDNQNIILC